MKQCVIGTFVAILFMTVITVISNASGGSKEPVAAPPTPAPIATPDPEAINAWVKEIVARTKGDYAKLTDEERERLDSLTMRHGKEYFEIQARKANKDATTTTTKKTDRRTGP
jgi:hypothetical protein